MAYVPVDVVEVVAWDRTVGAVALDPRTGFHAFEFDPAWLRTGIELAPLTLPARRGVFVFPDLAIETFHRLPAMLADALPDRFGNALIDAHLAREGLRGDAISALDRLAYLGARAMGALEFRPPRGPEVNPGSVYAIAGLVEEARRAVRGSFGTEHDATAGIRHLLQVGTSAGGARAKAIIAWNPLTNEIRSGQVGADPGFEHWLLKFDGVGRDSELGVSAPYGRVEYAYYLMARAAGIEIGESRLLEEGGRAHFMTRRFDRPDPIGTKVHMQSLCAMAHLDFNLRATHDYAQLIDVVDRLGLGPQTRAEVFRRAVFNVAAANCDDHTKNHGFTLEDGGQWRLAPAYDLTHAYNPAGRWTYQHLMGVGGVFSGISPAHLIDFADRHAIPGPRQIMGEVADAIGQWPTFAAQAGLAEQQAEAIATDFTPLTPA